jgi:acylphosphatase
MAVTLHVRVSGRVQGVGYREGLRSQALAHGVAGWVRNRRDGSVEAVLQGEAAAVEAVLAWARRGPPAARVAEVQAAQAEGEHDRPYVGFDWLATA